MVDPVLRSVDEVRFDRLFLTLAEGEITTESVDVGEFAFDVDSEPPRFVVGVSGSGKGRGWCLVETIFWRVFQFAPEDDLQGVIMLR